MTIARADAGPLVGSRPSERSSTPLRQASPVEFAMCSHSGKVRQNNEDKAGAAPEIGLFVLCDGMGGLEAGERASQIAVETLLGSCRESATSLAATSESLSAPIELANENIFREAQALGAKSGMGSTIVAVQLCDDRMIVAHVGDSRVYRLRRDELCQLTDDHSFVAEQVRRGMITIEEANQSQMQNVLTRALGVEPHVTVEVNEELLLPCDTLLLCSDGLTRELSDSQIAGILSDASCVQDAANQLIRHANEAGGKDNVTVIVIRNSKKPGSLRARLGRWIRGSENNI
jgi:protein phosphatase